MIPMPGKGEKPGTGEGSASPAAPGELPATAASQRDSGGVLLVHPLPTSGAMHRHGWLKKCWPLLSCHCPALCPALILSQPGLSCLKSFNGDLYTRCQSCCPLRCSCCSSLPPHLGCFDCRFQLTPSVLRSTGRVFTDSKHTQKELVWTQTSALSQACPKLRDRRQRMVTAPLRDARGRFSCILAAGWKGESFLQMDGVEGLVWVTCSLRRLSAIPPHLLQGL